MGGFPQRCGIKRNEPASGGVSTSGARASNRNSGGGAAFARPTRVDRRLVNALNFLFLDCGFARIRCPECGDEFLLAHPCKSRCLCPSCQ
ncbi:MAG: transposase zinc-binding domain-containing protein [Planctomycetia bacterium]|nr:transposase zinc-binding domain-containing protein [Planctomycetia bacterium]